MVRRGLVGTRDLAFDSAGDRHHPIPCGCLRPTPLIERIEAAYLEQLLARIQPFEAWVVRERHGLSDPPHAGRSADDIGYEVGLEASRVDEIETKALVKMLGLQTTLAAD